MHLAVRDAVSVSSTEVLSADYNHAVVATLAEASERLASLSLGDDGGTLWYLDIIGWERLGDCDWRWGSGDEGQETGEDDGDLHIGGFGGW